MESRLPTSRSAHSPHERGEILRVVARRGLCGLANDTKWDEFINAMRARSGWVPSYRFKCIDGPPMGWDVEWFYHLPFPMVGVEWFDVAFLVPVREHRIPPRVRVTDHSGWIEELVRGIGLDYRRGATMIRIFGYSPRSLELFDE